MQVTTGLPHFDFAPALLQIVSECWPVFAMVGGLMIARYILEWQFSSFKKMVDGKRSETQDEKIQRKIDERLEYEERYREEKARRIAERAAYEREWQTNLALQSSFIREQALARMAENDEDFIEESIFEIDED